MERKGKYIYGIIDSNGQNFLGPYGIIACKDIYIIPYENVGAVVRDSEIVDYNLMFKDKLARFLVEHQKVIEKIMSLEYAVIPMRLGTFVKDETEVKDILSRGYYLTKEIMEKIKDRIEIDIACTWSDFTSIIKEAGEEKEIKEFKERLLAEPKGITVEDQMKIGFMLKKALDERREEFAERIVERLRDLSEDTRTHELMDDNMVLNSAFLINKAKHKDFEVRVEELNIEFAEKLNFRCVGPLPPYSFYTLEIKKIQSQDIVWARNKLNLNEVINKEQLKKAYQRSAFSYHPDKNPNTPGIEKEFNEVAKAYKILVEYCQAREQAGKASDLILNETESNRDALLVKLKD